MCQKQIEKLKWQNRQITPLGQQEAILQLENLRKKALSFSSTVKSDIKEKSFHTGRGTQKCVKEQIRNHGNHLR